MRGDNIKIAYSGRKNKHVAGKTKKSRCCIKKHSDGIAGNPCPCGCFGKKILHIPFPYKDHPKVIQRARKWKKKRGIEICKKAKKIYEGED